MKALMMTALTFIALAPLGNPAFAAVDVRKALLSLEERVTALEQRGQAQSTGAWTCSAQCGGFNDGHFYGMQRVGSAATVEEAFHKLGCNYDSKRLYVDAHGQTFANVQNSCVFDPNSSL